MLEPIQNQALRLCLGAFRTSPVESLQVEANEPPLAIRRNKLALQYAVKLKSNPANPTYHCTFESNYNTLFSNKPKTIPPFGVRISNLLDKIHLDLSIVTVCRTPSKSPWTLKLPTVSFELHREKKSSVSPDLLRAQFYAYISDKIDSFHIYTDGSKDLDGVVAAAVCHTQKRTCRLLSQASVFSAEAKAISLALEIVETSRHKHFYIFSDSMSCLQAIHYQRLENPAILQILENCHILLSSQKYVQFCWIPSHVGIKGNEVADAAAKNAIHLPIAHNTQLPYTDLKQDINTYFYNVWQELWNITPFNKLQAVKPNLGVTKLHQVVNRRDQVVLHRARIGHTYLTHSYLLKRENNPDCQSCQCLLTVQHILIDCPKFKTVRIRHFQATSLSELFNKVRPLRIIDFLKEIKLYLNF